MVVAEDYTFGNSRNEVMRKALFRVIPGILSVRAAKRLELLNGAAEPPV
jgi:hypothetical protein